MENSNGEILLIEDELMIQKVTSKILTKNGYKVTCCLDGIEALEIYKKEWQKFELIILDLMMPIMGGEETYIKMKRINPNLNVIISSGYSDGDQIDKLKELGVKKFITKPYKISELLTKIKSTTSL